MFGREERSSPPVVAVNLCVFRPYILYPCALTNTNWTTNIQHNTCAHEHALLNMPLYLPLRRRVPLSVWALVLDEAEAVAVFITSKGIIKHVSVVDKDASTSIQCFVVVQFQDAPRRQQHLLYYI